jgi:signal transduction histidine kinase
MAVVTITPTTRRSASVPGRRSGLGPWLHTTGVLVVAYWLLVGRAPDDRPHPVVVVVGLIALAAWGVRVFLPSGIVRDVLLVVMLLGGSLAAEPTQGLLITPAVIAVSSAGAESRRPIAFSGILAAVGLAIVTAASLLSDFSGIFVLACAAGFGLGVAVGYSRRQTMRAQERELELLERDLDVEREHERSALLADRAAIARDIHDVLAHSLGGLVIQLDAVEALLESGRGDEAATRVTAARRLAAEGLGEARRAVAALRDPSPEHASSGDALSVEGALDRIIGAHGELGGRVDVIGRDAGGSDALEALDDLHRRALAAVTREALSNARRHAPGETVTLVLDRATPGILRARLSNAVPASVQPASSAAVGGGHGLVGMRERIAELHDGSTLSAGETAGRFVVDIALVTGEA